MKCLVFFFFGKFKGKHQFIKLAACTEDDWSSTSNVAKEGVDVFQDAHTFSNLLNKLKTDRFQGGRDIFNNDKVNKVSLPKIVPFLLLFQFFF